MKNSENEINKKRLKISDDKFRRSEEVDPMRTDKGRQY